MGTVLVAKAECENCVTGAEIAMQKAFDSAGVLSYLFDNGIRKKHLGCAAVEPGGEAMSRGVSDEVPLESDMVKDVSCTSRS